MGVARGFRQAVAGDAGQREFDGCLETHAMTDGDIDRLHSGARAHYRPDGLCAIDQRRPRSFHVWRFVMMAGEPGLRGPDGGDIQQHPEMAGEAEAARVRDALAVAEDEIGSDLQPGQGRQHSRQLAESKQSGQHRGMTSGHGPRMSPPVAGLGMRARPPPPASHALLLRSPRRHLPRAG